MALGEVTVFFFAAVTWISWGCITVRNSHPCCLLSLSLPCPCVIISSFLSPGLFRRCVRSTILQQDPPRPDHPGGDAAIFVTAATTTTLLPHPGESAPASASAPSAAASLPPAPPPTPPTTRTLSTLPSVPIINDPPPPAAPKLRKRAVLGGGPVRLGGGSDDEIAAAATSSLFFPTPSPVRSGACAAAGAAA